MNAIMRSLSADGVSTVHFVMAYVYMHDKGSTRLTSHCMSTVALCFSFFLR